MSKISATQQQIKELLWRNVERAEPAREIRKQLEAGRPLRVKLGIDPTSPQIHLGNAVVLWKLREFQELGHQIVFIVGDFTARIGDPSDKSERRPVLAPEQIKKNLETYKEQVSKILDLAQVEFHYNSKWLEKLEAWQIIQLARLVTVGQMLARRNFKQRYESGQEIGLDEFLYPLFQGYDSYAIEADIELGGTDQLFNLQMGRRIQEALGQDPQTYLITKMLIGTDGAKMSKSRGNVVNITDEPAEMFGKLMALNDDYLEDYLWLATRLKPEEIKNLLKKLQQGANPKTIKKVLAFQVVKLYHGEGRARLAQAEWERVFEKKEIPTAWKEARLKAGKYKAFELLTKTGLELSNSSSKRVIEQAGLKINGKLVKDWSREFEVGPKPLLIQKGKKDFLKIISQ